jgi:hypothetical protein
MNFDYINFLIIQYVTDKHKLNLTSQTIPKTNKKSKYGKKLNFEFYLTYKVLLCSTQRAQLTFKIKVLKQL